MAKPTFRILRESDKQLVLECKPGKLKKLDEDELLALHARVRRARDRQTTVYRRSAAAQVGADKARAHASKAHARDRARAEVLEKTLARVSRRLAKVAAATADDLKASRLAAARSGKGSAKPSGRTAAKGKPGGSSSARREPKSPATMKSHASTLARGARRQARHDTR